MKLQFCWWVVFQIKYKDSRTSVFLVLFFCKFQCFGSKYQDSSILSFVKFLSFIRTPLFLGNRSTHNQFFSAWHFPWFFWNFHERLFFSSQISKIDVLNIFFTFHFLSPSVQPFQEIPRIRGRGFWLPCKNSRPLLFQLNKNGIWFFS